jgi:hypothetical protein
VLDEAVRADISHEEGHRLVMLVALSTAGLSWREAAELIDASPELALDAQPEASAPEQRPRETRTAGDAE